jgi:hypothetical protein
VRILKRGDVGDPPIPLGSWVVVTDGWLEGWLEGCVLRLSAWDFSPHSGHDAQAVAWEHGHLGDPTSDIRRVAWVENLPRAWVGSVRPATAEELQASQLSQLVGEGL